MASEPEVSIITGKITEVGGRFVWIWPGTRVALLPNIDMAELTPGTRITVRAVRRHGQFGRVDHGRAAEQRVGAAQRLGYRPR